jgi:hypothetical protein
MKHLTSILAVLGILAPLSSGVNAQIVDTFGSGANQFSLNFVTVGNPGNANDTTGYGGVSYNYNIGVYDISQTQLSQAAASSGYNLGGGAWTGSQPAANVDWYQAAAFVNYLNTSQGYAPAYNLTFSGSTPTGVSAWTGSNIWTLGGTDYIRNANAEYFLPSENEFYKAAYYGPGGTYYQYATGSNTAPTAVASGTAAGTAVYNQPFAQGPAAVNQAGGLSSYGTMGQSGNVFQWNETDSSDPTNNSFYNPVLRGGSWGDASYVLSSSGRSFDDPANSNGYLGFRVASVESVPEPSTYLLVVVGLLGLAMAKRKPFKL